jgi:hypothetical protein
MTSEFFQRWIYVHHIVIFYEIQAYIETFHFKVYEEHFQVRLEFLTK